MKSLKKLLAWTSALVVVGFLVLASTNVQAIQDWWKLRGYTPPSAIMSLAGQDTMTTRATHLLYINHPQLVSNKSQFRGLCPQAEQTIVLGCYHSVQNGIAIYDVTDSRLSGIEEVTIAHEMLHAAYDRMSPGDKSYVDSLLTDYYNNDLHDKRILSTIDAYKKTEPNDVVNEMHSVFGTEVANLPAPLENYYRRYFTNRQAVTHFSSQYEAVFTQNQSQLSSLQAQIDSLKAQLSISKQSIGDREAGLSAQQQQMQNLLRNGQTAQFNAQVSSYNAGVRKLQANIALYNDRVNQLNALVDQYNQLAVAQDDLYNSINTSLQPQSAQ